ncbi:PQQ-binding-like beta-propeller repeat protein [Longimicrobium terrae]|uniref:Outer membrane protein assembly factor BamB n=1 Tax=Longimicrobium terrae TaxID=1639882 RepID=A0A841GKZ3_9BACT|nr:PQQ-binding-like beta-propeller repeat protein [Longimicrobium terrae]MBB4634872.1 outer membrane protein assembly factor BamB [Longimicrobium terrae]MBB6069267.1 outer membrane protein assembly factor BamB [Longimicrobium terrae]NNC31924.1 PQQ-like beta-propeller repeat protein [Longimicrobium terrae]
MKRYILPRCFRPPWTLLVLAINAVACAPDGTTAPAEPRDKIEVVWRTPITASGSGREDLAIDDHAFYTLVNGVTAYDLNSGALLWNVPESRHRALNLVVSSGRLFVSSTDVQAIDARTGTALWRTAVDSLARTETTADDRAVYVGTDTRRVVALDVSTGRPLWSAEVLADGAYRESVIGIVAHGDTVYAAIIQELNQSGGAKRGWMVALDRNTGRVLWRYVNERLNEPHDVGGHAVAGRMLLMNDLNGGAMIGLDRFTGQEVWRKTGPRDRRGAWDSFKVVDGVGYVASNDTHLYSVDPESGRTIWQTGIDASASSSAVCGDKVFADAFGLHMVRRSDGHVLATLFLDENGSVGSSYVISRLQARGNRVYFVGNDAVYAVTCK